MSSPRVLSLYEGFFIGGSRIIHTEIVSQLHAKHDQDHQVLSVTDKVRREFEIQHAATTPSWAALEAAGIPVSALNREPGESITREQLAELQHALDSADVILSLKEQPLTDLHGLHVGCPLFVAVHRTDPQNQGAGTCDLIRWWQSGVVTRIIACAEAAKMAYMEAGLPEEAIVVVPNGINLSRFREIEGVRDEVRFELGIPSTAPVVTLAARFAEMKNVPAFVSAMSHHLRTNPDTHFIMCGTGMRADNDAFQSLLDENLTAQQQTHVHALGITLEMERIYNATDIVALTSSFGEAAPLCLLEGMACGAVPVSTSVGDTALMVGNPDLMTTLDPRDIAETWTRVLSNLMSHRNLIQQRRSSLSEEHMVNKYAQLIQSSGR